MQVDRNTPVIDRINEAQREGKKTALFLGREDRQSLPKIEGWEWFSLNTEVYMDPPLATHLVMDFNDPVIARIHHLFNKVVFDWSTVKFCENPLALVRDLLINDESSEAVLEQNAVFRYTKGDPKYFPENLCCSQPFEESYQLMKKDMQNFEDWKTRVGEKEVERRFIAFKTQWNGDVFAPEEREHELNLDFQAHILEAENLQARSFNHAAVLIDNAELVLREKYFNSVETFIGPYPYRNDKWSGVVWILKSPKQDKQFILNHSLKKAEKCLDKLL